ncbi:hypothetical protein [Arthrobacter terrae]|uniref:hypothetical protein n=1 Tax=Arthrobacter terrae TaxID=2935737 RepID=UPI001E6393EE|nr:hypothetical protein [Arthrobacter terrae]
MVGHIDFQGDPGPGGTVIRCLVRDFASDAPPLHRLYTPTLLTYTQGSEAATEEDLSLRNMCVDYSYDSAAQGKNQCATKVNLVPQLGDQEQLITLPEEQGIRDSKLIIIGAVAAIAATALLEVLKEFAMLLPVRQSTSATRNVVQRFSRITRRRL